MSVYIPLIKSNNVSAIRSLLQCSTDIPEIDPRTRSRTGSSGNDNQVLTTALESNNEEIIRLFLNDSRVMENLCPHTLFKIINKSEHREQIMELILNNSLINIDDDLCEIFKLVHDNEKLMKLLLDKSKEDLEAESDELLTYAAFNSASAFELLLSNPKINPVKTFDHIINTIARSIVLDNTHGNLKQSSKLILSDSRLDMFHHSDKHIVIASSFGFTEIIKQLLSDEKVDPQDTAKFCNRNFPIRMAFHNDHLDIVNILARDPRINLDNCINDARSMLSRYGSNEMANYFRSVKKEINAEAKSEVISEAKSKSATEIKNDKICPERAYYKIDHDQRIIFADSVESIQKCHNSGNIELTMRSGSVIYVKPIDEAYHIIAEKYDI